jgi:HEAT repeat protein
MKRPASVVLGLVLLSMLWVVGVCAQAPQPPLRRPESLSFENWRAQWQGRLPVSVKLTQGSRTQYMGMNSVTYRRYMLKLEVRNQTGHAMGTSTGLYLIETAREGARGSGRGGVLTVAGGYFRKTPLEDYSGVAELRKADEAEALDISGALGAVDQARGEAASLEDGVGLLNVQSRLSGGGMSQMLGPMFSFSFPAEPSADVGAGFGSAEPDRSVAIDTDLDLAIMVESTSHEGVVVLTPALEFRDAKGEATAFRYLLTFGHGAAPAKPGEDVEWTLVDRLLLPIVPEAVLPLLSEKQGPLWRRVFAARWAADLGEASVPALSAVISARGTENDALRASALLGLGATRQASALQLLMGVAQSSAESETTRRAALRGLGLLGQTAATSYLVSVALGRNDEDAPVAVASLGQIGDKSAADPLLRILEGRRKELYSSASEALQRLADNSHLDRLAAVARNPKSKAAQNAVSAVGGIKTPEAVALLADLLRSGTAEVKKEACRALGHVESGEALAALRRGLESEDKDVRQAAIAGIAARRSPERTAALRELLSHPDEEVRKSAVRALGKTRAPEAKAALAAIIGDTAESVAVREAAVSALRGYPGDETQAVLIEALADPAADVRKEAIRVLDDRVSSEAVTAVTGALQDAEGSVRGAAAGALSQMKAKGSAPALVEAFLKETEQGALRSEVDALVDLEYRDLSRFLEVLARLKQVAPDNRRAVGRLLQHLSSQDHTPRYGATPQEVDAALAQWQTWWDQTGSRTPRP